MRVGVFGGSFDPIHNGHLIAAEAAADELNLDQVRFVPAAAQPFKRDVPVTAARHRVAMLQRALAGNPRLQLDLREIERGGISYTIDTLRSLRAELSGDALFLLVGADAARHLPEWRDAEILATLATIVTFAREGAPAPEHPSIARAVWVPAIGISATAVRDAVRAGRSVRYRVPDAVHDYISTHRLYLEEG